MFRERMAVKELALLTLFFVLPLAIAQNCAVEVPPTSFGGDPPNRRCTTCSCKSSKAAKFDGPSDPRFCCSTNTTATYRVAFIGTWSARCHANYTAEAKWSEFVALSHRRDVKIFDACFEHVSRGLQLLAQTGDGDLLVREIDVMKARREAFDYIRGSPVPSGSGRSAVTGVKVHPHFPYVSAAVMQGGTADRILGVSQLRLCRANGKWQNKVKICSELFSTATNSTRVGRRNSVQGDSCSFGYFEFSLEKEVALPPHPTPDPCRPKPAPVCPDVMSAMDVENCPTCCCENTKNVEFYHPKDGRKPPRCTAPNAVYEVVFHPTWSNSCHSDYYFSNSHWSPFSAVSHNYSYVVWNPCMYNVSDGVALLSQTGSTSVLEGEYRDQGDSVKHFTKGDLLPGSGRSTRMLSVDADHSFVSVASMLAPSMDRMMGVSGLQLCNVNEWKEGVKVCGELFSTATKSDPLGRPNTLQMNNCSFGHFFFSLKHVLPPPIRPPPPPPPPPLCRDDCPKVEGDPQADSCLCQPKLPKCTKTPVQACSTCCCNSTDNVEFYNPGGFNPPCTASEAVYRVKFVGSWTARCHPDYYFRSAHWSPLTGVSHDPSYEVWNACMYNVSRGVEFVSRFGSTGTIRREYSAAGSKVKDTFGSSGILGAGIMMDTVRVNASHSYVTALTMLAPSADRMMGVSRLQLCQRTCWKDRVVVCGELFSTATASVLLGRPNTIQFNNCSFGYFEFKLLSCDGGRCGPCPAPPPPRPPPPIPPPLPRPPSLCRDECPPAQGDPRADSCLCQPKLPKCIETPIEACSTCCCNSTGNVEFYNPRGFNPSCTASEAVYRVKFVGSWTAQCHPDYYFPSAHWSPLTGVSHDPSYEVWNACMYNVSTGVALVSQTGSTRVIEGEYGAAGSKVKDTFRGRVIDGDGTMMDTVRVNASHSYVTALTMLAPSADRMMGVSRLQLCQRTCWKDRVVVCGELFSTATKSDVLGRPNTIQFNNCSFGYFEFELVSCEGEGCGPCPNSPPPRPPCPEPLPPPQTGLKGSRFVRQVCRRNDFVFSGFVVSRPEYVRSRVYVLIRVVKFYKCPICGSVSYQINLVKVCLQSLPNSLEPFELGKRYMFAGAVNSCPRASLPHMQAPMLVDIGRSGFVEAWGKGSLKKAKKC